MMTNERAMELIETAWQAEPVCSCGQWTTVVAHGDEVRLVCPTLEARPARGIRRLFAARLELTHVNHPILRDSIVAPAA